MSKFEPVAWMTEDGTDTGKQMSNRRERFEKEMRGYGLNFSYSKNAYAYEHDSTQCAWLGWQAAERAALERAAQECEQLERRKSAMMFKHDAIDGSYLNACDDCAETIRALMEKE